MGHMGVRKPVKMPTQFSMPTMEVALKSRKIMQPISIFEWMDMGLSILKPMSNAFMRCLPRGRTMEALKHSKRKPLQLAHTHSHPRIMEQDPFVLQRPVRYINHRTKVDGGMRRLMGRGDGGLVLMEGPLS